MQAIRSGSSHSGLNTSTSTIKTPSGVLFRINTHRVPHLQDAVSQNALPQGYRNRVGLDTEPVPLFCLAANLKQIAVGGEWATGRGEFNGMTA